jgi:hypothetical protein
MAKCNTWLVLGITNLIEDAVLIIYYILNVYLVLHASISEWFKYISTPKINDDFTKINVYFFKIKFSLPRLKVTFLRLKIGYLNCVL